MRYRFLIMFTPILFMSGCGNIMPEPEIMTLFGNGEAEGEHPLPQEQGMHVDEVKFSPDYKTFYITTSITRDLGPYALTDSTSTKILVTEKVDGITLPASSRSKLVKAINTESDEIARLGIKILAIVDLTLPQEFIDAEQKALKELRTVFNKGNLFVSFMGDGKVSETVEISDYILDNYFRHSGNNRKLLYRSILDKETELMMAKEGVWKEAGQTELVVFSDGKVYNDDNSPVDPHHFIIKKDLLSNTDRLKAYNVSLSYVSMLPQASAAEADDEAANLLKALSNNSGGIYQTGFNMTQLEKSILKDSNGTISSNRFEFENPDHKVYRGDLTELTVGFYNVADDSLITSFTAEFTMGNAYSPVIVHGIPTVMVLTQGGIYGLLILLTSWLLLQFAVPYIRYRVFLKKYVISYNSGAMSIDNITVGKTCYICKAAFEDGEKVVVKCRHPVHKVCWDENGCRCPEYGSRCTSGSHYYNPTRLTDSRNAVFHMRWTLAAILASIFSWGIFTECSHSMATHFLENLILSFTQLQPGTPEAARALEEYGQHMTQSPAFGLCIGFFLTLALSPLSVHVKNIRKQGLDIFCRSVMAGIICYAVFLTACVLSIFLKVKSSMLFDWIPWSLCSYVLAFAITYRTRIKLKKSIIYVSIILGITSMLIWALFYSEMQLDYRVLLLINHIAYALVLAICIAEDAPRSEHYFLKVQGAIKTMDIALYKWLKQNPHSTVTIGKSVDCSLQMSWDIRSNIAPVQAEIGLKGNKVVLVALEPGVTSENKQLKAGSKISMYHGLKFKIGDTQFTYVEKDSGGPLY